MVVGELPSNRRRCNVSVVKRPILLETFYIDHLNTSVCLEQALPEDLPQIEEYLLALFGNTKISSNLCNKSVIIARDYSQICGVLIGYVVEQENLFMDLSSKSLFYVEALNVEPIYQSGELGTKIWIECLKMAQKEKCQFVVSKCSLNVSMSFAFKMGMRIANKNPLTNELNHLMIYDLKNAENLIEQHSQLKLPNAYKFSNSKRTLIHSTFVEKLSKTINVELALLEDIHVLHNYLINEFFKQTPLFVTLGFQREESIELAKSRLDSQLILEDRVLIMTDESYLIGLMVCRDFVTDKSKPKYDLESDEIIDLTKEIDSMNNVLLPIAKYRSVTNLINSQISYYVPNEVKNFSVFQMAHLHANYRNCSLSLDLGSAMLMLAYQKGYRYVHNMATSIAADKQTSASGAKPVLTCLYNKFQYKNKPLFPNGCLVDGLNKATIFQIDFNNF